MRQLFKYLTQNRQNIPRSSRQNDKSKTANARPSIKTMFQKGPGKNKASHQPKAEMEANKKKNAIFGMILMKPKLSTNSLTFILNL